MKLSKVIGMVLMLLWVSSCGRVIKQLDTTFGGAAKTVYPEAQSLLPLVIPPELAFTPSSQ